MASCSKWTGQFNWRRGIRRKLAYGQEGRGLMAPGYSRGRGYRFSLSFYPHPSITYITYIYYYIFIVAPRFIYILFICRPTNSPDVVRSGFLSKWNRLALFSNRLNIVVFYLIFSFYVIIMEFVLYFVRSINRVNFHSSLKLVILRFSKLPNTSIADIIIT